jgi:hypothetical protein
MAFLIPENAKSRADMPAAHRRTMSAFQVGLDETVTVWYEPLFDPSGEKPHMVVLLPDMGIVVLEVLDVATGGGLLGALRGRLRLERDGREVEVDSPLVRAEQFAEILKKRIAAEERLKGLQIPVAAGAVLPNISGDRAQGRGLDQVIPPSRCLFQSHIQAAVDGSGEAMLLKTFREMLGRGPGDRIGSDVEQVLRGIIQPDTVIDGIPPSDKPGQLTIFRPPEDGEDIIRIMDKHQEAMAKSLGEGHRVIRGVAGSGKTLILVYRAKLLSRLMPNDEILVTCYTRSLAGQLRTILAEQGNVTVRHLDKIMWDVIREAGMRHPGYGDDESGDRIARTALEALEKSGRRGYRAVLVDEAQDFGTDALRFVIAQLEEGCDDLVVVADAAQNIFRRRFSWKQAGIQAQGRTKILRVNYRNTREILEFASSFLLSSAKLHADEVPDPEDENALIPPEAASRSGPPPLLVVGRSLDDEITRVVEQAITWSKGSTLPRRVAILYGSSWDDGKERAKPIYDRLKAQGASVFWMNDPADKRARDRLAETEEPVVLATIHSAKGLEFPFVVLCGVWNDRQDEEVNRKLAYVGMTRASSELAVITRQGHPLVIDLEKARA